jgi:hypothetical protein
MEVAYFIEIYTCIVMYVIITTVLAKGVQQVANGRDLICSACDHL